MTDRLPEPECDASRVAFVERASAASARPVVSVHEATSGDDEHTTPVPRSLREIEEWMVFAITSRASPSGVASVFSDGPRQRARARFEIHRSGYRARLVECLEDDYPVLAATLGTERFEALSWAYMDRYPSSSPSLNLFGRHMAAFCRDAEPLRALGNVQFHSELAELEWAIVEAIHARAAEPLDGARLLSLAREEWSRVRFVPSDAVRLLRFEFPVNAYYQAHMTGRSSAIPERAPSATAVYRRGLTVWRMNLTPAMTRVLDALLASAPLGEALSRITVDETDESALEEAERSVMVWFREWVSGGFFSGFSS